MGFQLPTSTGARRISAINSMSILDSSSWALTLWNSSHGKLNGVFLRKEWQSRASCRSAQTLWGVGKQGIWSLFFFVGGSTLPETNSKSPWKWMVGIRSFPFGMDYFQGRTVSSRECLACFHPGIIKLCSTHFGGEFNVDTKIYAKFGGISLMMHGFGLVI